MRTMHWHWKRSAALVSSVTAVALLVAWATRTPPRPALRGHTAPSRLLPVAYWWHRAKHPHAYARNECATFPEPADLRYVTAFWQRVIDTDELHLYGAYWDDRFTEPRVRLLMYSELVPLPTLYCQLWYLRDGSPEVVEATATYNWKKEWGGPQAGVGEPYVMSCAPHRHARAPLAVSLVPKACSNAPNALLVQNAPVSGDDRRQLLAISPLLLDNLAASDVRKPLRNNSVAVCLKWINYNYDMSARLVEWLQFLKHFEVELVYIYLIYAHPNVRRVVDYYVSEGFVVSTDLEHPEGRYLDPELIEMSTIRRELASYNDCLYRSIHKYRWIAAIDLDEIIVPVRDGTWRRLIARELAEISAVPDGLVFPNVFFPDTAQRTYAAPPHAHMLASVWRSRSPSKPGWFVKSFHSTSTVVSMHNHTPLHCGTGGGGVGACGIRPVAWRVARVQHYRAACVPAAEAEARCEGHGHVRDRTLWRWANVMRELDDILHRLNIDTAAADAADTV